MIKSWITVSVAAWLFVFSPCSLSVPKVKGHLHKQAKLALHKAQGLNAAAKKARIHAAKKPSGHPAHAAAQAFARASQVALKAAKKAERKAKKVQVKPQKHVSGAPELLARAHEEIAVAQKAHKKHKNVVQAGDIASPTVKMIVKSPAPPVGTSPVKAAGWPTFKNQIQYARWHKYAVELMHKGYFESIDAVNEFAHYDYLRYKKRGLLGKDRSVFGQITKGATGGQRDSLVNRGRLWHSVGDSELGFESGGDMYHYKISREGLYSLLVDHYNDDVLNEAWSGGRDVSRLLTAAFMDDAYSAIIASDKDFWSRDLLDAFYAWQDSGLLKIKQGQYGPEQFEGAGVGILVDNMTRVKDFQLKPGSPKKLLEWVLEPRPYGPMVQTIYNLLQAIPDSTSSTGTKWLGNPEITGKFLDAVGRETRVHEMNTAQKTVLENVGRGLHNNDNTPNDIMRTLLKDASDDIARGKKRLMNGHDVSAYIKVLYGEQWASVFTYRDYISIVKGLVERGELTSKAWGETVHLSSALVEGFLARYKDTPLTDSNAAKVFDLMVTDAGKVQFLLYPDVDGAAAALLEKKTKKDGEWSGLVGDQLRKKLSATLTELYRPDIDTGKASNIGSAARSAGQRAEGARMIVELWKNMQTKQITTFNFDVEHLVGNFEEAAGRAGIAVDQGFKAAAQQVQDGLQRSLSGDHQRRIKDAFGEGIDRGFKELMNVSRELAQTMPREGEYMSNQAARAAEAAYLTEHVVPEEERGE